MKKWLRLFLLIQFILPLSPVSAQEQHECDPAVDYIEQGLSSHIPHQNRAKSELIW